MIDYISAVCITNLDAFRGAPWPRRFVSLPRIGDLVAAKDGKVLKVVGVTHAEDDGVPCIFVELHR